MLLDGLGWSRYSVFAPCIMTLNPRSQTVWGRLSENPLE